MVDVRTNLLKNRRTLSEKDYQKERDALRWSVVAMVVVVVIVIAFSVWNFVLTTRLSAIDKATKETSKQMQGLTKASTQQVYLKSRLQMVTNFLADRSLTRESLQKIFSTSIPGTSIVGVTFESDTILGVQYNSSTSTALKELLAYYTTDTGYFTQVVSRGLSRQKDGTYQMTLALTLPKGAK